MQYLNGIHSLKFSYYILCYDQEISNIPGEERVHLLEVIKVLLIERRER
jgi:hypothetical protein